MKHLLAIIVLTSLAGCYEDSDVTLEQAGIYKGKTDKHTHSSKQREALLVKRFKHIQTDR